MEIPKTRGIILEKYFKNAEVLILPAYRFHKQSRNAGQFLQTQKSVKTLMTATQDFYIKSGCKTKPLKIQKINTQKNKSANLTVRLPSKSQANLANNFSEAVLQKSESFYFKNWHVYKNKKYNLITNHSIFKLRRFLSIF